MKIQIRINNIEFRKYGFESKTSLYEIIKWQPNPYFGKEEEFKNAHESCFEHPESCYVLAFVEPDNEGWELRSVGERLIDLNKEEWNEFHEVYKLGQAKLNKE